MDDETGVMHVRPLGRPPLKEGEARRRRTVTFLTDSEFEKLSQIARRNNMSISSLAHKLLIQSLNSWK
jgi:hypothetical protein